MIRFLADENLNGHIVAGLRRRLREINLITAIDAGLKGSSDPDLLEWAAIEDRVVLTHDVTTLIHFANERMRLGLGMPGIIAIKCHLRVSEVIEDLILISESSNPADWQEQIHFLPLK